MKRLDALISYESNEYIERVMKDCGLKKPAAVEKIIEEHRGTDFEKDIVRIKDVVARNNKLINNLDKKMDILISVINSIALNENYEIYVSPERRKSPLYEGSSKEVETKKAKELTIIRKKR